MIFKRTSLTLRLTIRAVLVSVVGYISVVVVAVPVDVAVVVGSVDVVSAMVAVVCSVVVVGGVAWGFALVIALPDVTRGMLICHTASNV